MPFDLLPRVIKPVKQWVLWRRDGEQKQPVNPFTLGNAGVSWSNTWGTFAEVLESYRRYSGKLNGIGFVLTENDPFVCVDLDDCFNSNGLTAFAVEVLERLSGYAEVSPSGNGLHIWVRAPKEQRNIKRKGFEIYSSNRWLTMTGKPIDNYDRADIPDRSQELSELIESLKLDENKATESHIQARQNAIRAFAVNIPSADDDALWTRLFNAHNGHVYRSLYAGDTSVCHNDESRAVIFLANQLAVMTEFDENRIKRMLYQTGLVSEKWESRRGSQTWLDGRIEDAINYMSRRRS